MKAPALSLLFAGALALTTSGLLNQAYAQIVNEADAAAAPKGGGNKGGGGERGNRGDGNRGDGNRDDGNRGGDRSGGEVRNFSSGPGPGNAKAPPQQTFRTEGRDDNVRGGNRGQVDRDAINLNDRPSNAPRYQANRPNFDNDRIDARDRNKGNWGGRDGDWHRDNDWRYSWYGDRWWFWLPTGRWAYWYGGRWNDYYYDSPTVTLYNNAPDDNRWRYKYVNGIWWYWLPEGRWVFWMNGQWNEAPPAPVS